MATPPTLDPNIAALDPMIKKMRRTQAGEILRASGQAMMKMPAAPRKDYSAQRARYIAMLNQLDEYETKLRQEDGKTLRSRLSMASTLFKAIASMEVANVAGRSGVQQERLKVLGQRIDQLSEDMGKRGPREFSDIAGTAAGKGVNALAIYADGNGGVKPGNAVAFVDQVNKDLATLTDPRDAAVYVDAVKKQYGIDLPEWLNGKGGDLAVSPAGKILNSRLQQATAAQIKAAKFAQDAYTESADLFSQLQADPSVAAGSALGRGVNTAMQILGGIPGDTEAPKAKLPPAPPATASLEDKKKYVKLVGGAELDIDDKGNVVETADNNGNGVKDTMPYTDFIAVTQSSPDTAGGAVEVGAKRRPYLGEQRKLILRELEKLENAEDPVSRQTRQAILASPQLAAWAKENGYESYRPEQQFKAMLSYRRKQLGDQDAAFRKQLDSDILAGEAGTGLGRAAVKARRFLTGETAREQAAAERQQMIETGLEEARRRQKKGSDDLTSGAQPPSDRTPDGRTESDPKAEGPTSEEIWGSKEEGTPSTTSMNPPPSFRTAPAATIDAAMKEEKDVTPLEEAEKAPSFGGEVGRSGGFGLGVSRGRAEARIGAFLRANAGTAAPVSPAWVGGDMPSEVDQDIARRDLYAKVNDAYAKAQTFKDKPAAYNAALQNIAAMIEKARAPGLVLSPGADQRSDALKNQSLKSMPGVTDEGTLAPIEPTEEMLWGTTEDDMPEEDAPDDQPDDQPEDVAPAAPADTDMEAPAPAEADAEEAPASRTTGQKIAGTLQDMGRGMGQHQPQKPVMFESFGAEDATKAAEQSRLAFQTATEERRRRLAALRGSMSP